ncbi:MAG: 50S ribosomal protein L24, partial [Pseudomonadota bacterium]|nr:50S ribosomal protein L24 [Pseudomonadota bacterium]
VANGRAVVQGVNIARRHTRPSQTTTGGIVDKEMPIAVSNLSHIDPKDNEPTRIGFKFLDDNRKVRYAKRSGEVIDS